MSKDVNRSPTAGDVRDAMRLLIINACETPPEGKQYEYRQYMRLQCELSRIEQETAELEELYS